MRTRNQKKNKNTEHDSAGKWNNKEAWGEAVTEIQKDLTIHQSPKKQSNPEGRGRETVEKKILKVKDRGPFKSR